MAVLLSIDEPAPPAPVAPNLDAFLEMAFRPIYLAGALWAAVAVVLWVFAPGWLNGTLGGVAWHAHEMLWGFVATIAVGFLMTAGAAWTGINPVQGRSLAALCVLWIIARAGFLMTGGTAFLSAALAEVAFFALAAAALARAVVVSRNVRNYGVPLLLLALGATDALFLAAARTGDYATLMRHFNAGLLCMALLTLLVARRVIPFFAMRAVPGLTVPQHLRSGQVQLAVSALAVVALLAGQHAVQAAALAIAGAIALVQWLSWKPWAVLHKPLLWVLYVGYGVLGAGLLLAALDAAGLVARAAVPVHVIAMGGFSVLIIGMITRTALGHLGRPLETDRSMVCAYALVIAATVLRLGALYPSAVAPHLLHGAAALWAGAFALYLWRFVPMMIRPRADRPVPAAAPVAITRRGA
jgi:uncharacterized protein involved in response to NO